jgi:cytochrome c oxidase subunit 4
MAEIAHGGHGAALPDAHEAAHHHPGDWTYIKVALFLLVITVAEVAVYYIQWMHDHGVIVPLLLAMSAVKFVTVVGFFMHLKFDDRRLTIIFAGGLAIAFATIIALDILFHVHPIDYTLGGFF